MITQKVIQTTKTESFRQYLGDLLVELCNIDTTPQKNVATSRERENAVFSIIERELGNLGFPNAYLERRPIEPKIAGHPAFTPLYSTRTAERPEGMTPEEAYHDRHNLLFILGGASGGNGGEGTNLALNAHIDVVAPFVSPHAEGQLIYGRGACDDKGQVAAIVAALKVLSEVLHEADLLLKKNLVCMFVIEEETGGNGSLSLAIDQDLKRFYDSVLVFETAENGIYPANRGAVWYQTELTLEGQKNADTALNLLEMSSFVIEGLEIEGRAIRAESRHPLFPQRPVQTCHGIIGPFGEHPSRICGDVQFRILWDNDPDGSVSELVTDIFDSAVAAYCSLYGDKTTDIDQESGKPKVDRHYELKSSEKELIVSVHGSTGHMGSILENDGAITKMAYMIRGLIASRSKIASSGRSFELALVGHSDPDRLEMEGGQGFVPTHNIKEITQRIEGAVLRGVGGYLNLVGSRENASSLVSTSFSRGRDARSRAPPAQIRT